MMMMLSQDEIDSLLSSISTVPVEKNPAITTGEGGAVISRNAPDGVSVIQNKPLGQTSQQSSLIDMLNAEKEKNYKIYNFKRPDKFSKDQLRALETIHESFARNSGLLFTSFLRTNVDIDVISVDQLTYDELVKSMPRPITVGVIEGHPLSGQMLMGVSHEVTMCLIDRMLGGTGGTSKKPRELSDIELNLMEHIFGKLLANLSDSWQGIAPINYKMKAMEESYHLLQITAPGEIVAAVTLEVTIGSHDSGLISLCYPYPMLEAHIESLSSQHLFTSAREKEDLPSFQDDIIEKVHFAQVPVSVIVGGTSASVRNVMDLRVNDVLRLDRLSGQDLLVCVNHKPKFYCQPGTLRNNMAVCIQEMVTQPESVKGFALDSLSSDALEDDLI